MRERTVITLSGVVGAGKSTAAKEIVTRLRAAGREALHVRFQEFVRVRGERRHDSRPGRDEQGEGSENRRIRWGGYRRRRLSLRITAGYILRTMLFRARMRRWPTGTILVFDRYFYDSLVHFDLDAAPVATRLLLRAIPVPSRAAIMVIPAGIIQERRPTYAPEYAKQVAHGYRALAARLPQVTVVDTGDFAALREMVTQVTAAIMVDATEARQAEG